VGVFGGQIAMVFYNAMVGDLVPRDEVGRWSGRGCGPRGYAGGFCCLLAVLLLFVSDGALISLDRESAAHIRAAFPFVAVWLVVFTLPVLMITPDRPSEGKSWRKSVEEGFRQLRESFSNARRYRDIFRFLIARMFYMDGLATMFALGGVYAAGTYGRNESRVLVRTTSTSQSTCNDSAMCQAIGAPPRARPRTMTSERLA